MRLQLQQLINYLMLAVAALYLQSSLACATKPAKGTEANTNIKNPCQEKKFNDKLIPIYEASLAGARRTIAELASDSRKLKLALCKEQDTRRLSALKLLVTLTDYSLRKADMELATKSAAVEGAITVLNKRNAQLLTLMGIKPGAVTYPDPATTAVATSEMSGSSRSCTIKPKFAPTTGEACKLANGNYAAHEAAATKLDTLKSYTPIADAEFAAHQLTVTIGGKGDVNDGSTPLTSKDGCSTDAGHNKGNIDTGMIILGISPTKSTYTTQTTYLVGGDKETEECAAEEEPETKYFVTAKHLAYTLCRIRNNLPKMPDRPLTKKIKALLAEADVQQLAYLALNGKPTKETTTKQKEEAAEKLLGTEDKTAEAKFVEPYNSQKFDFKSTATDGGKSLTDLADSDDYGLGLAICNYEATKKAIATTKTTPKGDGKTDSKDKTGEKKEGDNKPTAAECKATEEGKCDKEKCTWNKEKNECKVKEGAVVISAVIKAPLLLAVLLTFLKLMKFAIFEKIC
uniref:Variant surface glycoprotein 1125.4108 n=1 Tax=Trypanosoma brucei TaxID=5691 RepID=A0A1J0R9T3_9TRYP|nr:variant surface glycoprotein 1125.4108 [Trypanosoma brucei]